VPNWVDSLPEWLKNTWLIYVTTHDWVQWVIMAILAKTAWGQRQKKREVEELIAHIHEELHTHIEEDASFHTDLGQRGMTKGR
jgi:hypothetical protein